MAVLPLSGGFRERNPLRKAEPFCFRPLLLLISAAILHSITILTFVPRASECFNTYVFTPVFILWPFMVG